MDTLTRTVTTRELRADLANVLGQAQHGGGRIGVTRNGKLTAVVIGVADMEDYEALEDRRDEEAYLAAKAADDGTRVAWEDLKAELGL